MTGHLIGALQGAGQIVYRAGALSTEVSTPQTKDKRIGELRIAGYIGPPLSLVPNRERRGGMKVRVVGGVRAASLSIGRLEGSRWRGGPYGCWNLLWYCGKAVLT